MTDSENENIFSYPNVDTVIVSAKGPNTNISNLSIRQPSSMYMPRNFERQRYAQSVCDQRSMYRRETSPMSTQSAFDMRPYNFQPYYPGMSSQRSMISGRGGSPTSLRSMDSSTSIRSAKDIVLAIKTSKLNFNDIQSIKHALKFHTRKRFERKRNRRMFLKTKSGYASEQASESSISSDECRSAITTTSNVSQTMSNAPFNFPNLRKTGNNNRDCADVRQNTFRNIVSFGSASLNHSDQSNKSLKQNNLLRDRFKSSFLLPSQRFNQSVASTIIPENCEKQNNRSNKNAQNNTIQRVKNHIYQRPNYNNNNTDSEDETIFTEAVKGNIVDRTESHNKRSLSEDELNLPYNKRKKISSPTKNTVQKNTLVANNKNVNNFEFIKPTLPAKKVKPKIQEKLISKSLQPQEKLIAKSSQPLIDIIEPGPSKPKDTTSKHSQDKTNTGQTQPKQHDKMDTIDMIDIIKSGPSQPKNNTETSKQPHVQEKTNIGRTQTVQHETMETSDISMRPSFIKRKLFTQKLDVIEKSNVSSDSVNSPQSSIYGVISKEKNKARKLVTTQSCLNREVQDDNNLMDLIHKIVPPDQMNATNQSSVNQTRSNATKPVANEKKDSDKWDITAVISMCNDDDCSDTYTDEEILKSDNKMTDVNPKCTTEPLIRPCRVDIFKVPDLNKNQQMNKYLNNKFKSNDNTTNKLPKSFWDTDSESDFEWLLHRGNLKENQQPGNITQQQETKNPAKNLPTTNTPALPDITKSLYNTAVNTTMNTTIDNVQKLKVGNVSFRSHRLPKKKKCCNETCLSDTKSTIEPQKKCIIDISRPVKKNQKKNTAAKSNSKSENPNKTNKDNIQSKTTEENALNKDRCVTNTKKTINISKPKSEGTKTTAKIDKSKSKSDTHSKVNKSVNVRNKTPKSSERNNNNVKNNKKANSSNPPNTSALDSTADTVQDTSAMRQRPLRTCRATSQNRSLEVSTSLQMSNDSNITKCLRSRTIINLSSSIENITFNIKPRCKVVKTVAQIQSRKSDVSFSLGNKNETTPIKMSRKKVKR